MVEAGLSQWAASEDFLVFCRWPKQPYVWRIEGLEQFDVLLAVSAYWIRLTQTLKHFSFCSWIFKRPQNRKFSFLWLSITNVNCSTSKSPHKLFSSARQKRSLLAAKHCTQMILAQECTLGFVVSGFVRSDFPGNTWLCWYSANKSVLPNRCLVQYTLYRDMNYRFILSNTFTVV